MRVKAMLRTEGASERAFALVSRLRLVVATALLVGRTFGPSRPQAELASEPLR